MAPMTTALITTGGRGTKIGRFSKHVGQDGRYQCRTAAQDHIQHPIWSQNIGDHASHKKSGDAGRSQRRKHSEGFGDSKLYRTVSNGTQHHSQRRIDGSDESRLDPETGLVVFYLLHSQILSATTAPRKNNKMMLATMSILPSFMPFIRVRLSPPR